MSAQGIRLDPEVEGLLREIAADPSSGLLRVERPKTLRPLLEREHAAGPRMAGLTNAERHLLDRYRDEVGYALLWGALILLRDDEAVQEHAIFYDKQGHRLEKPERQGWQVQVEALSGGPTVGRPVSETEGLELLLAASHESGPKMPGVIDLALASLRLRPTPHATIYCAEHWISHERFSTARLSLRALLQRGTDPISAAWAWVSLGMIAHRTGDISGALAAHKRAAAENPWNPAALRCSMIQALVAGDARVATRFARLHDGLVLETGESPDASIAVVEREISGGFLRRADCRNLLGASYESLGNTTRRIIDAMSLA